MIAVEKHGAVSVLTPTNPINTEHAEDFLEAVRSQPERGLPMVVVDLSSVALVDSVGLEAVLDARDDVRRRGGLIKLSGPPPLVAEVLNATGVDEYFEVYETAKRAVGSFSR